MDPCLVVTEEEWSFPFSLVQLSVALCFKFMFLELLLHRLKEYIFNIEHAFVATNVV